MKKPSEKARRRPTPSRETERAEKGSATVVIEGPAPDAPPAPYRVVWRCSFGPREAAAADADPGPPNDESR